MVQRYSPRDPQPLARVLMIWLWLDLAATVAGIPATLYYANALSRHSPDLPISVWETLPGMEAPEAVIGLLSLAQVAIFLGGGFLSLKWIYRASRNAHALAEGLSVRPPWAVGWFFVPLANLLMPFRGLREAWQASADPSRWRTVPVPSLLRWWWGLWLLASAFDGATFRMELQADTVALSIASQYVTVASFLIRIPLLLVFLRVVRRLTDMQTTALHQRAFE